MLQSDKYGARMVVKFCILTGAAIPIIAILIEPLGLPWYIFVFLLVGFITSGRDVGFEPLLLDIAPDDRRTKYLGIRGTANILVVLLPILGGLFIDKLGFHISFYAVSSIMLCAFFLLKKETLKNNRLE